MLNLKERDKVNKSCHICDQEKKEGITLYSLFICRSCEKEIIQSNPGDVNYQFFIEKLKVLKENYISNV